MTFSSLKSHAIVGVLMIAVINLIGTYFSGSVIAMLPFEPYSLIRSITHRNIPGQNYFQAAYLLPYILTAFIWRNNIKKIFGYIITISNKHHGANRQQVQAMLCYDRETFLEANAHKQQNLALTSHSQYLLKLERFEKCNLSLCSDIRLYFFLFEYARRQQNATLFSKEEALNIFPQQVEIACLLKKIINLETTKPNKYLLSNNHYICSPILELRTVQPLYRIDPEGIEDSSGSQLSPQAYLLIQQGQTYRLRKVSN